MNAISKPKLSNTEFRRKVLERFPFCSDAVINFNYVRYLSVKGFEVGMSKYSKMALGIKAKFKRLDKKFLGMI